METLWTPSSTKEHQKIVRLFYSPWHEHEKLHIYFSQSQKQSHYCIHFHGNIKNYTFHSTTRRSSPTVVFHFYANIKMLQLHWRKAQTLTLLYSTFSATFKLQVSFKSTEKESHYSIPLSVQDRKSKSNSTPPRDSHTIVFHFQRNIASRSLIQQHRDLLFALVGDPIKSKVPREDQ